MALKALPLPGVNEEAVKILERIVADLKSQRVRSVAIAVVYSDACVGNGHSVAAGTGDRYPLMGAIREVEMALLGVETT